MIQLVVIILFTKLSHSVNHLYMLGGILAEGVVTFEAVRN